MLMESPAALVRGARFCLMQRSGCGREAAYSEAVGESSRGGAHACIRTGSGRAAAGPALPDAAGVAPVLRLPGLGEVDAARLSLPVLTLPVAGMDAFNPCAFFVLLFLLSLLMHQRDRRRMLLIGMLFVAVSGLMYFAFMAAWLGLFLVVGGQPWVPAAAGVVALVIGVINVKDFVALRQGLSLSIPEGGKADSLPAMLAACSSCYRAS